MTPDAKTVALLVENNKKLDRKLTTLLEDVERWMRDELESHKIREANILSGEYR